MNGGSTRYPLAMLRASALLALSLAPQETSPLQAVPDEPEKPEFVSQVPS